MTYCNPLPNYPKGFLYDKKQGWGWTRDDHPDFRESADSSVLFWQGKWYLYISGGSADVSTDFVTWEHHPITRASPCYAPTIVEWRGEFWLCLIVIQDTFASTRQYRDLVMTPAEDELRGIIDYIHAQGLKVQLRPMLESWDRAQRIHITFPNEETLIPGKPITHWTQWFQGLTTRTLHYATLAQRAVVHGPLLVEMGGAKRPPLAPQGPARRQGFPALRQTRRRSHATLVWPHRPPLIRPRTRPARRQLPR
ncbi:MAG: hypothetical protein H7Y06_04710 [Opitutaceae bacterium]|nr:hypothetical protein [Opitutaceae bacterium]